MKCYKLLSTDMTSAVATGEAQVLYFRGERAQAPGWLAEKGYHLTAFESLEDARLWSGSYANLWECEGEEQVPVPPKLDWGALFDGHAWFHTATWPTGTVMFKYITLLRRVKWE